jgi:hypothetical protein
MVMLGAIDHPPHPGKRFLNSGTRVDPPDSDIRNGPFAADAATVSHSAHVERHCWRVRQCIDTSDGLAHCAPDTTDLSMEIFDCFWRQPYRSFSEAAVTVAVCEAWPAVSDGRQAGRNVLTQRLRQGLRGHREPRVARTGSPAFFSTPTFALGLLEARGLTIAATQQRKQPLQQLQRTRRAARDVQVDGHYGLNAADNTVAAGE